MMESDARIHNFTDNLELTGLIGVSAWARQIRAKIVEIAACPSNVLITGPTGTGKDVIARAIHASSARGAKPFIPVDCAGSAGPLFASHLFGHLKGAFTGAGYSALGCFRAADGGTIFLDEVGELPSDMQTKLLRVLQQRRVTPVGSHEELPVNVRVIAATNRDLEREVSEGRFREDLYYRLNVISVKTLPLRDRPADIQAIAEHFLNKLAITHGVPVGCLSAAAVARLRVHDWPGNVRQLENELERAAFSSRGPVICEEDILTDDFRSEPDNLAETIKLPIAEASNLTCGDGNLADCCMAVVDGHWRTMEEVEREHIRRTLALTGWNQSAAARILDMERHQLARKIRKYGLDACAARQSHGQRRAA
jgi:DNA-binding NtrC family response regulator